MKSLVFTLLALNVLAAPGYPTIMGMPCKDPSGQGCLGEDMGEWDLYNQMIHAYKRVITVCAQSDLHQPCTVIGTKLEGCTNFLDGDLNGPGNPIKSAFTTDVYGCSLFSKAHCDGIETVVGYGETKLDLGLLNNNVRSMRCIQNMQPTGTGTPETDDYWPMNYR